MSFILDAIAKSEHERQQQEIPDARILAAPVRELHRPQPRRISPFLVVGILLLIVIVLLIWRQTDRFLFNGFSQTENSTMESGAANQTATPNNVASENETLNLEKAISSANLNQANEIARSKTSIPSPGTQSINAPDLNKSLEEINAETSSRVENAHSDSIDELDLTLSQKKAENSEGSSFSSKTIEPDTPSVVIRDTHEAKPAITQNKVEPESRKIYRLSELPADVRRDLPSVSFSGHLYSKKLNVSYVMVGGGQSVIAGQQIADDLFLHEVTPTGAIIDFRGFLIEIGILQNWSLK